jgi:hypothetical protein
MWVSTTTREENYCVFVSALMLKLAESFSDHRIYMQILSDNILPTNRMETSINANRIVQ